jgi:hypothetical protein
MTGVSPNTLDDVTSGFNIAEHISLDSDLNEIMGFTPTEVETMIEYYRQTGKIRHSTPELLAIMSQWYNHYRFSLHSSAEVFNTVHVLYFLKEYMKESRIPGSLIDQNARIDYMKLRHLIVIDQKGAVHANGNFSILRQITAAGSIHSDIIKSFPIKEMANPNHFISLFYYFGLLTIGGVDEENTPVLTIPNEIAKRLFYDYIRDTYRETGAVSLDMFKYEKLFRGMAYRGNWQELVEYIAGRMEASLSLRDLNTGEKELQVFWNVYLGLGSLYNVYSEREMGQGFCDLTPVPLLVQYASIKYSYLLEFKYIKLTGNKPGNPQSIKKLKKEAISQRDQYCPDEKFQKAIGHTILKKLVLIFCGNRLEDQSEV